MPRALKGILQVLIGLAFVFAFVYPHMAPVIRQSRAIQSASKRPAQPRQPDSGPAGPDSDRILRFSSDLSLRKDGTIEVLEEFTIHSAGGYFRYGVIRALPIDSEARWDRDLVGEWTRDTGIRVKILDATDDGSPVSFEQGRGPGYQQLRLNWAPLDPGDHHFVVRYQAEGVLQYLAHHDQLYWNAVGDFWRLPVDNVVLRVHLPPELPRDIVTSTAYAGHRGANKAALGALPVEQTALADGFEYHASNLGWTGSLSVALTWPKGFLAPPALGPFTRDAALLIPPVLLFIYYVVVWLALGRQPQSGAIAVQYQPPRGLSPAAMRYIRTTACDSRALAATIAQLAARGLLTIERLSGPLNGPQNGKDAGKYKLTRIAGVDPESLHPPLAPEEKDLLLVLFEDGPTLVLDPKNGNALARYVNYVRLAVQKGCGSLYFTQNARFLALGGFASFLMALAMGLMANGRDVDRMPLLFLTFWFFFCWSLLGLITVTYLLPAWGRLLRGLGGAKEVLIGSGVVGIFAAAGITILTILKSAASPAYALAIFALVAINIAAFPALRRLTPLGRQVRDEIEGFRQFLEKVEQDPLRRVDASQSSADAPSEFMGYAIALEIRETWGDHLAEACAMTTTTSAR